MKLKRSIPALPVEDIQQSVHFYTTKFGFSVPYHDKGFARLIRDEVEIHLWAASDEKWKSRGLSSSAHPIISGAESFLAGTASCRIEVQGIEELYEELKMKEVMYNTETIIQTQDWGTKEFHTLDHHRNLVTFYERVT